MDHRDIDGGPGYDADLESRLYAEIHYSNDTYPDQLPSGVLPRNNNHSRHGYSSNNSTPNIMNQYPSTSPRYRSHSNAHPKPHQNSWELDPRANCEPYNSAMYSRNHQGPGISSNYNYSSHQQSSSNYSRNNEMYSRKSRPLMDNYAYSYPSLPQQYDYMNDSMSFTQLANNYNHSPTQNRPPSRSSVPSPAPHRRNNNIDIRNRKHLHHNSSRRAQTQKTVAHKKNSSPAKKKAGRNKEKVVKSHRNTNSHRENVTTATISKNVSENSVEDTQPISTNETTSKYDVAAKSNQPQEINPSEPCNSVDIPSDSDESIFEVPVPPKPQPLLIDLKDSDETSNSDDDDEEQSSVVMSEKSQCLQQQQEQPLSSSLPLLINDKNTNSSETIIPTVISSSESTRELPNANMNPPTININSEEISNDIDTISNNIIINCTQVATGVTTLADIRRIRESANAPPTIDGLSDDSMTESEAMKWGQIEGQMGGNNGDKSTNNEWNRLPRNSDNSIDKTAEKTTDNQSRLKYIETAAKIIDETLSSFLNIPSIYVKRKRSQQSESESEINNELNNSAKNVDENKAKKPANEKSFEESLHEPRPKKLEQFYNEPRPGIMMLDVHKIQSRMPSDPNRWPILDADKGYTVNVRNRKKKCSLCHREGHLRDKCPNHREVPTCHMCGEVGHFEPRCPHSMCLTCGTKFSSYRKTCENCRNTKCNMCKSIGHTSDTCPDLWRRYHQTTPPNASVKSSRETGTSKLSSSKSRHIHNDDCKISEKQSNNEIMPSVNQSESSNLKLSVDDKSLVGIEIKNESLPSSSSSTEVLNGHIFFHWKSSNLWPDNLIQNYTRLNDIEGSIIDGLISGTIFPAFITELDDICPFELIMGYHNGFAQMFLQTYSEEVLELLKKLIIMWLIRNDDEKWLMIGSMTLPINRRKLLHTIKERQVLARSTWSTADQENMCNLLKQIDSRKKIIEDIYKSYPIVRPPDVQLSLEKVETTTNDIKWRVVLCLYYCEWIKGAKEIIDNFHTMIMELERNKFYIEIPVTMYLKILQFCNEVFTPHTSQHIIDGAKRCVESMSKKDKNEKKISSPLSKNKVIMQTLYKLMFEYELCKRKKKLSNRKVMKKFDDIENLLLNCPENDKYTKSLESYRELLDGDGSIQQLTVILGYFTSLLRKKLGLSEEWRKKTVQKICKDLEEIGHLNKLSDLNNKTAAHGSVDISSDSDSDVIEVPVEKKKIEELTIDDDENNKILNDKDDDDDEDYDDSELIRKLKEIMKTSTTATSDAYNKKNVSNESTNANESQTNLEDDNEEAILLNNLAILEELIDDPELQ
ncbi:hypothetical protein PV327_009664 [Microctonus hyperodae]|uniref:Zinc finger CCHC domain-containing protein 7 n=1 Tax=Microctonus hyperodae TaxID=165561 RepID=A0AA39EZY2_MICHY|nr:hypothetical protein PV327_009664 [Microctonus hyperodae]